MESLILEVFKSVATQGPLVGFLFYLVVNGRDELKQKDARIKEMTDLIIQMGNQSLTIVSNNTEANVRLREAINDLKRH